MPFNRSDPTHLAALKNECQTDPRGLALAALYTAGNDTEVARRINEPRDTALPADIPAASNPPGTNPANGLGMHMDGTILIRRSVVPSNEFVTAILVSDYTALPGNPTAAQLSTERRYLSWLTGLMCMPGGIPLLNPDGTNGPVAANLEAMFPPGSGTRNRIIALTKRHGSRAEELWGEGSAISAEDIGSARAS